MLCTVWNWSEVHPRARPCYRTRDRPRVSSQPASDQQPRLRAQSLHLCRRSPDIPARSVFLPHLRDHYIRILFRFLGHRRSRTHAPSKRSRAPAPHLAQVLAPNRAQARALTASTARTARAPHLHRIVKAIATLTQTRSQERLVCGPRPCNYQHHLEPLSRDKHYKLRHSRPHIRPHQGKASRKRSRATRDARLLVR